MEAGVRPWHQPWAAGHPAGPVSRPLRANGVPYRGINVVVLWCAGMERGYTSPYWLTFNQARELGGCVRKGEKGTTVVYANAFEKTTADAETGEEITERIPFLKAYTVFNAGQVDGLPARYAASPAVETEPAERLAAADAFFAYTGADTRHGGGQAYYRSSEDYIQLPTYERFGRRGRATTPPAPTSRSTGPGTRPGWPGRSASGSGTPGTRWKSWWPNSGRRSSVPTSASPPK